MRCLGKLLKLLGAVPYAVGWTLRVAGELLDPPEEQERR